MRLKLLHIIFIILLILSLANCNHNANSYENNPNDISQVLEKPKNLKVSNITYLGADISWDAVPDVYDYYILTGSEALSIKQNFYKITNKVPGKTVNVSVIARDSLKKESEKSTVTIHFPESTANESLYPYPKNFRLVSTNSTEVSLNWDAVQNASYYFVYLSTDGINYSLASSWNKPGVTILSLKTNTKYYFKIATNFSNGVISKYSPVIVQTTTGKTKSNNTDDTTIKIDDKKTDTKSIVNYTGSKCYLEIKNYSGDAGHYIYKIVISDKKNKDHIILSKTNIKIKSSKDSVINSANYDFRTNEKYPKNDLKVTVYAKGGKKGAGSGVAFISPSSTSLTNVTLYWSGYTLHK